MDQFKKNQSKIFKMFNSLLHDANVIMTDYTLAKQTALKASTMVKVNALLKCALKLLGLVILRLLPFILSSIALIIVLPVVTKLLIALLGIGLLIYAMKPTTDTTSQPYQANWGDYWYVRDLIFEPMRTVAPYLNARIPISTTDYVHSPESVSRGNVTIFLFKLLKKKQGYLVIR